ncbi:MAG: class I SAM-dependent methyltransferase [Clostridiaceae bacterium]|nr:class I SAM-dependent methyltransferase [Clostridiaceae bacterium]
MIDFNRLNALGNTAIGMSFIRGKESLREDALFYDKLAVEIYNKKNNIEKSIDDSYIIVRTKFFDDTVSRILKNTDFEQVVVLGIGLDIRFQRLDFKKKLKVFEIDQPEVIQFRQEVIPQLNFKNSNAFVQIGLTFSNEKSLVKELTKNDFDKTKKTLWVLEGLLCYQQMKAKFYVT